LTLGGRSFTVKCLSGETMKILFAASEALPFAKTGGLADVLEGLPRELAAMGHEVAVVLPRYRGIEASRVALQSLTVPVGAGLHFPVIHESGPLEGVRYFFVDAGEYFDRGGIYGEWGGAFHDNPERFMLFSRAVIEIAKQLWPPDVFHCHDWQAALVPVLLRGVYGYDPALARVPVVFTVHNIAYQGRYGRDVLGRTGLPDGLFTVGGLEFWGDVNFLKGGLLFADYVTTVSRKYAEEIQTPDYGHGLDAVVRSRASRLVGILNGADYSAWSPEKDRWIAKNYSAKNLSGKAACKKDLLAEFRLPAENNGRPVVGIVSRFVEQKGFDLIAQIAREFLEEDVALVALGSGEARYESFFRVLAEYKPERVGVRIGFDNALAHKIEAGADMFLMPSRYEPCGLNQIYSLRYGTIPVVRATGGLDDTIEPFEPSTGRGTGFKFWDATGSALLDTLRWALQCYRNRSAWKAVMRNAMSQDFSWQVAARQYLEVYEKARALRPG
jgi:starch synthase